MDDKTDLARRRLLKAVLAGGLVGISLLPSKWTRPVVEMIAVPAHAQTSPLASTTTTTTTVTTTDTTTVTTTDTTTTTTTTPAP